ncbi:uncharacterized protein SPPG_01647 [Spizellomyces punctatus DAOM BR117]|uniref:Uncharacterized protein n=1 Tax=Spizellomyces punctatus (strain DAOM BR117) TaxID=645134 RepID=A0A0L0HTM1_SPIPD|nr:uncharacterized protein SPPG_01647 [Spizellomyces punctatus DAOM BR117]KND04214.1 hypothetical protein SPPG_01647 [Spizellomyces punctatus DAOM BR117]|eukprot:XP_016612253.1 hypothetical protein SPPG_01647 [Spizellomyces punctatus DAOM BR117]
MAKKRSRTAKDAKDAAPRDLAPTQGSGIQKDMPRKYRNLLAAEKFSKRGKNVTGKNDNQSEDRRPGESLGDYSKRVDDKVRSLVNTAVKSVSKTRQKKKEWLAKRKAKSTSKRKGQASDDEDDRRLGKDNVKFGTVAMQPPSITAVPKQRGNNQAAAIAALQRLENARAEKEQESQPKDTEVINTVGRKRKLKTLPEVERIAITNERERAIAHYRAIKGTLTAERPEEED